MMSLRAILQQPRGHWRIRPATMRLLAVLLTLLLAKSVVMWRHWSERVTQVIRQADRATHADESVALSYAARGDTITQTKRELIVAVDSFIFAPTAAQATTVTASLLARDADAAGVRLGTIEVRFDSVSVGGTRTTTVEGEASGEFSAAVAFLRELERGNPFFVRRLSLTPISDFGTSGQLMRMRFAAVALARRPFEFER